jgi:hypothetical protein
MSNRRKFMFAMIGMMMSGTAMAAEPTLATVYLNPT